MWEFKIQDIARHAELVGKKVRLVERFSLNGPEHLSGASTVKSAHVDEDGDLEVSLDYPGSTDVSWLSAQVWFQVLGDPVPEIDRLRTRRDALDARIKEAEEEIAREGLPEGARWEIPCYGGPVAIDKNGGSIRWYDASHSNMFLSRGCVDLVTILAWMRKAGVLDPNSDS